MSSGVDYYALAIAGSIEDIKTNVADSKHLQDPDSTDTYDSWYDAFATYCTTFSISCNSSEEVSAF